jgi:hypothetical protein
VLAFAKGAVRRKGFVVLALTSIFCVAGVSPANASGGRLLPPQASPYGYSIESIASELAQFSASGNDPQYLPDTKPIQVLYAAPETFRRFPAVPDGNGVLTTGSNSFTVRAGTVFFVPLWNADDSPPYAAPFPTTDAEARSYFFDPDKTGGRNFEIIVDGKRHRVGPAYLTGPFSTPPLPDGGGTHMITLGAFLSPLDPGRHVVSIRGGVFGADIKATYEEAFFREAISYRVDVRKGWH